MYPMLSVSLHCHFLSIFPNVYLVYSDHQRTFLWPVGQKGHDTHEHNNFAQRILPCEWINIPLMSINSLTGMEIKNSDCCQVDLHTIYFYNAWWNVERYSCFNLIQDNKARQGLSNEEITLHPNQWNNQFNTIQKRVFLLSWKCMYNRRPHSTQVKKVARITTTIGKHTGKTTTE